MSWLTCDNCLEMLDTDADPDCFIDLPTPVGLPEKWMVMCERCRLRHEEVEHETAN